MPSDPSIFGRPRPTDSTNAGQSAPRPLSGNPGDVPMPRGGYSYDQNPMNFVNQNNPNLAQSIFQGRQTAMRDQPFRAGYAVTMPGTIPPDSPAGTTVPNVTSYMPRISSDVHYGRGLFSYAQPQQRRPRWNYGGGNGGGNPTSPQPPTGPDTTIDSGTGANINIGTLPRDLSILY